MIDEPAEEEVSSGVRERLESGLLDGAERRPGAVGPGGFPVAVDDGDGPLVDRGERNGGPEPEQLRARFRDARGRVPPEVPLIRGDGGQIVERVLGLPSPQQVLAVQFGMMLLILGLMAVAWWIGRLAGRREGTRGDAAPEKRTYRKKRAPKEAVHE